MFKIYISAAELACELSEMCGVNISAATIRRTWHRTNLRAPRRKPILKPRHKTERLKFACTKVYWEAVVLLLAYHFMVR